MRWENVALGAPYGLGVAGSPAKYSTVALHFAPRAGSVIIMDDLRPAEEALAQMRKLGGSWYAYRNEAMDSSMLGHLKFLKCGPGCTFEKPPRQLPDTQSEINWPYQLVGPVDMETGKITRMERRSP